MKVTEPVILVLAGQGHGGGVEFRTIKIRMAAERDPLPDWAYPRSEFVDDWASLTTDLIPQDHNEVVLIISRYADQDETPWVYVAEYAKANLRGQRRNNHYSGVGVAVRASIVPDNLFDLIHEIHAAMITELLPKREFERSILDWVPPTNVLQEISRLKLEPLAPGFSGIQPGRSLARVLYSRSLDGLIYKAQTDAAYAALSALVLSSGEGGASKDVYVRNEKGIDSWIKANSPRTPSSYQKAIATATDNNHAARDRLWGERTVEKRDPIAQLKSDVKALDNEVAKLTSFFNNQQKSRHFNLTSSADSNSIMVQWAIFGVLLYLSLLGTAVALKFLLGFTKT